MAVPHLNIPSLTDKDISRFWAKVDKRGPEECWPWTGSRVTAGYGSIGVSGHLYVAHRIAYLIAYGPFAPEFCVLHACDNRPCCNPTHLWLGTHAENMADMARKGRAVTQPAVKARRAHPERVARGERQGLAKLTDDDVRRIRHRYNILGITQTTLAVEYNLTQANIHYIVHRKTWKHVG